MVKKKIKIYLQKSFGVSDSAYYKYLSTSPPNNVEYTGSKQFGIIVGGGGFKRNSYVKQFIKRILRSFNISVPNAYYTKDVGEFDLIHCAHCLSKNMKPWIMDIEYIGQFWWGSYSKAKRQIINEKVIDTFDSSHKDRVRRYLNSKYCKKILPWSEWTKNNILREFPELKDKVEIVHPAIPLHKVKNETEDGKIRILFVGRDFGIKGGEIALRVIDNLTKKYSHVEGVVVSDVPREIFEKYSSNKKIKFLGLVPQEKLFERIYPSADIFLYPTFSDTLGFAILEAQSFGIPVIAMKTMSTHTIEETILDGKTGFIIRNMGTDGSAKTFNDRVVDEFVEKTERLIKDAKLLKKMGKSSMKEITHGKFSIKERNKKLGRIYREATAR